jgi:hypothetical protein
MTTISELDVSTIDLYDISNPSDKQEKRETDLKTTLFVSSLAAVGAFGMATACRKKNSFKASVISENPGSTEGSDFQSPAVSLEMREEVQEEKETIESQSSSANLNQLQVTLSEENQKQIHAIRKIYTILAKETFVKIIKSTKDLKNLKKQVSSLHPLSFLNYVPHESMKSILTCTDLAKKSLILPEVYDGFGASMKSSQKKGDLKKHLNSFVWQFQFEYDISGKSSSTTFILQKKNIPLKDAEKISAFIDETKWKELLHYLFVSK